MVQSSLKPLVVLLDQDEKYTTAADEVLRDTGYEVYATPNPFEAINIMHSVNRPLILLMDYTMTEMSPRIFLDLAQSINRYGFFGILVTESIQSKKKRIMYEDALSDGIYMGFDKMLPRSRGKSRYDLGPLYRRLIMSAERALNEFTALRQDPLTGLSNRLGGLKEWQAVWTQRVMRNKGPLSFVLLDFNGMRITNNTYGHAAGDILIKKFAEKLQKESRSDDLIIRLGGDEFLIIMTNTSRKKAAAAIKRLKQVFNETEFEIADGVSISVRFCAGIATYTGKYAENTAESVFEEYTDLADQALYIDKAKNPKRNDLIVAAF